MTRSRKAQLIKGEDGRSAPVVAALAIAAADRHNRGVVVRSRTLGLCVALMAAACSTGSDSEATSAWDPNNPDGTGGPADAEGDGANGDGGADDGDGEGGDEGDGAVEGGDEGEPQCEPGTQEACLCPDGLHLGEQRCEDDGFWGACTMCDASDDAPMDDDADAGTDEAGDDGVQMPEEVCYPGADGSFNTCMPLHYFTPATMPAGYDYPGILNGDVNYRDPVAFIDLEENSASTSIAPNFVLSEIAEVGKGRWAIVQPHAVESLQALRDEVGAIAVNSGYRSPDYNEGVDGATYSRHMYGDGFDLDPVSVGLTELENACTAAGGMLVEYNTHVHCDFRFDDVDEEFFGPAPMAMGVGAPVSWSAQLSEDDHGVWSASHLGFDEGQPRIRWQAFDAGGELVATGSGPTFTPPARARSLYARVGRVIDLVEDL